MKPSYITHKAFTFIFTNKRVQFLNHVEDIYHFHNESPPILPYIHKSKPLCCWRMFHYVDKENNADIHQYLKPVIIISKKKYQSIKSAKCQSITKTEVLTCPAIFVFPSWSTVAFVRTIIVDTSAVVLAGGVYKTFIHIYMIGKRLSTKILFQIMKFKAVVRNYHLYNLYPAILLCSYTHRTP